MARFFDPQSAGNPGEDARLHAPATERNKDAILKVLKAHLPRQGTLLEVASGTGEHAAYMAPALAPLYWQPTDIEPAHLRSIDAWRFHVDAENMMPAKAFNVLEDDWAFDDLPEQVTAVAAINLIHIAPWAVAEALLKRAGDALNRGNVLYLYGPYKRHGEHTAPSNAEFDASLKRRNPAWGVRDMEVVISYAEAAGFGIEEIVPMPANNFSLIFTKG
ncbi:DUF938 domain-containing protein [Kordiimonas sp.]|uniref:DUF938 domain-containing protein n=1 Tax=Kordiimonas sp. TaxID=1970157 RepID=UPI003A928B4F